MGIIGISEDVVSAWGGADDLSQDLPAWSIANGDGCDRSDRVHLPVTQAIPMIPFASMISSARTIPATSMVGTCGIIGRRSAGKPSWRRGSDG